MGSLGNIGSHDAEESEYVVSAVVGTTSNIAEVVREDNVF